VSRSAERQLSFVEVEVLCGVVVHVRERHLALEERIPPHGESAQALHVRLRLCRQASFERSDHGIELATHSLRGIKAGARAGSPVVDDVEGRGSSVKHCREDSARVRQAVEDLEQGQEIPHDHVPEHHVEEQLSVRPPRPVAGPGEFFLACGFEQRMEGRLRPFKLCANRLAVAIVTVQRRTDCPFRAGRARPLAAQTDAAASSQPEQNRRHSRLARQPGEDPLTHPSVRQLPLTLTGSPKGEACRESVNLSCIGCTR
jgi:hypothetical protein